MTEVIDAAWEDEVIQRTASTLEPREQAFASISHQLELDWSSCLLLNDSRAIADAAATVIAVPDPRSRQSLVMTTPSNEALATSAGLPDELGRLDFSHLPHSTLNWISVTVRAPNACDADALAKIVWALGPDAETLLRDHQAEAIIIDSERRVNAIGAVKVSA